MAINFPSSPNATDTHTEAGITWVYDGDKWTTVGGSGGGDANHHDGPTAPLTGSLGDQWYNTDDGRLYTYTTDSSGDLVWIDASPDTIGGDGGSGGGSGSGDGGGGDSGGTTKADIYGTAKLRFTFDGITNSIIQGSGATASRIAKGKYLITFDTPRTSDYYVAFASGNRYSLVNNKTLASFEVSTQDSEGDYADTAQTIDFEIFDDTPAEIIVGSGTVTNTNIYGTAKALANFNGVGADSTPVTINGSRNVASITRNGKGIYDVVFTTPMANNNYSVSAVSSGLTTSVKSGDFTATGFTISFRTTDSGGNVISTDPGYGWFQVFDNTPAEVALTTFGDVVNYSGVAAWANIDGTLGGTNAPRNAVNVKSVTRVSDGLYNVLFTTPLGNADYSVNATSSQYHTSVQSTQTVNGFEILTRNVNGVPTNAGTLSVSVNALNALPPKGGTGTDAFASVKADGAINSSFNVASITKTGIGVYAVLFTSPMPSSEYAVTGSAEGTFAGATFSATNKTVNGFDARAYNTGAVSPEYLDADFSFAVNATNAQLPDTITQEELDKILDTIDGGGGGTIVNYNGASAWGDVAGDGTLKGGLNIASVTKTGTGQYAVLFSSPMPNENYALTTSSDAVNSYVSNKTVNGFNFNGRQADPTLDRDSTFSFTVHSANAIAPQSGVGADAWATVDRAITNGPCNVPSSFNVASVTRTDAGKYDVVFTTPMPSGSYSVTTNIYGSTSGRNTSPVAQTINGFSIECRQTTNGNYQDSGFSFTVHASSTVTPTYTWKRDGTTLKPANDGDDVDLGNIQLNADGSIDAAGTVIIGTHDTLLTSNKGVRVSKNGTIYVQVPGGTTGDYNIWRGYNGTTVTSSINHDGSAVFKGGVTQSNAFITLEDENPANFSADGEYTGPTLDVKERIQNVISRLDAIEANEQIDDATDTSLLQLVANASTRLDSIEARLTTLEAGNN